MIHKGNASPSRRKVKSISLSPAFISSPPARSPAPASEAYRAIPLSPSLRDFDPPPRRKGDAAGPPRRLSARSSTRHLFSIAPSLSYLPPHRPFARPIAVLRFVRRPAHSRRQRRSAEGIGQDIGDGERGAVAAGEINDGLAYLLRKTQIPLRDTILSPQRNASSVARPN